MYEQVVSSIEEFLSVVREYVGEVIKHPNAARYPKQNIILLNMEGYVYLVPYMKERGVRFLKTIIPSRKATKEYLG